jgi:hypothetical protein
MVKIMAKIRFCEVNESVSFYLEIELRMLRYN